MRSLIFTVVLGVFLSSCTVSFKTTVNGMGKNELEASVMIAPLISIKRVDEMPTGERHEKKVFGVTPTPTALKIED